MRTTHKPTTVDCLYDTAKLAYKTRAQHVLQNLLAVIQSELDQLKQQGLDMTLFDSSKQRVIEKKYEIWNDLSEMESRTGSGEELDANSLHLSRAIVTCQFTNFLNDLLMDKATAFDEEFVVNHLKENLNVAIEQMNELLQEVNERDWNFSTIMHYLQGMNYKSLYETCTSNNDDDQSSLEKSIRELEHVLMNDPNFIPVYIPLSELYNNNTTNTTSSSNNSRLIDLIDQAMSTDMSDAEKSYLLQLKAVKEYDKHGDENQKRQAVDDLREALVHNPYISKSIDY